MAKQTSINVQPVKGGSEQHNKRTKELDYVRKDLSPLNQYWESDTQANRLASIKELTKAKTGRTMQAKATPIREGVVVIQQSTTMEDLHRLADAYRDRLGIEVFQIAIHRDEGYQNSKEWKPNLHAHLVFDWTDHSTGKSVKLNRQKMAEMQTITAEVLGMERGKSSEKKHLTAIQFKTEKQKEELRKKEEKLKKEEQRLEKWGRGMDKWIAKGKELACSEIMQIAGLAGKNGAKITPAELGRYLAEEMKYKAVLEFLKKEISKRYPRFLDELNEEVRRGNYEGRGR